MFNSLDRAVRFALLRQAPTGQQVGRGLVDNLGEWGMGIGGGPV